MANEIPRHIAFVMDGNRRWAKRKKIPTIKGHIAGKDRIEPLATKCEQLGVLAVSFYTLSVENLNRPKEEINPLLEAISKGFVPIMDRLKKSNMRFIPLGDLALFPGDISGNFLLAAEQTKNNKGMIVSLALGYDGRDEITRAVRTLKKLDPDSVVTEAIISSHLDTREMPDPDLLIRTGGRSRLSGYLSWQSAYAELYFSDVLWPDFDIGEFDKAIDWYKQQTRTFGG